jgi:hypothetical protein
MISRFFLTFLERNTGIQLWGSDRGISTLIDTTSPPTLFADQADSKMLARNYQAHKSVT